MKYGSKVAKTVTIQNPRRIRYERFDYNLNDPLPTYEKRGKVIWVDWSRDQATIQWADGTRTVEKFGSLQEV